MNDPTAEELIATLKINGKHPNCYEQQATRRIHADQQTIEELTAERERIARNIHYPECWDTMAYPTLADAVIEITSCDPEQCNHPKEEI